MIIKKIELFHIHIPLTHPFETSFGRIEERPALIIKMTTNDGTVGYGESSPLSVPMSEPETIASGISFLKSHIPNMLGLEVTLGHDVTALYPRDTHPVSRIGLEAAYIDLVAKESGISVAEYFNATASSVPAGESVSLHSNVGDALAETKEYVDAKMKRIKLKIAPGRDRTVVEAVRTAFPTLSFGLDANAAYTKNDVDLLAELCEFGVAFIEQPFAADDHESHVRLRKSGVKVCLDETVRDLDSCRTAIEGGACDMVNIKPARIGSFSESIRIHDLCVEKGISLFGGGRLETGIGKTMNAAFYARSGFTEPSDITPPHEYLIEDIIAPPFLLSDGAYMVPEGVGIGVKVDESKMGRYVKECFVFEHTA